MIKKAPIHEVRIKKVCFSNARSFALIAGPCSLESRDHAFETCQAIQDIADAIGLDFVYKTSFDKANRSSHHSARGLGMAKGLDILADLRDKLNCSILTDVHEPSQCTPVARCVDALQIPAFLCRQTDLLFAAGKTGKPVNIKKGQFLAPWDMRYVADKVVASGNNAILICERGTSFGYNRLVCDMSGLAVMAETGWPVIFDASHAVQQPGGLGMCSGGERHHVALLARAAVAVGVAGLFIETHPDPDHAPSDSKTMIPIRDLPHLLEQLKAIDTLIKEKPI